MEVVVVGSLEADIARSIESIVVVVGILMVVAASSDTVDFVVATRRELLVKSMRKWMR